MRPESSIDQSRTLLELLARFARNPIETMRQPLVLTWPSIFSLQIGTAMVSGALAGMLGRNFWDFVIGLLVFPITSVLTGLVFSLFLYYFFALFRATYLDFRRLHAMTALAMVPYFMLHTIAGFLSPIDLIGFALAALLMIVGLIEQFNLDRKTVIRLIVGLSVAFFVAWSLAQVRGLKKASQLATPRNLDQLENEIKK